LQLKIDFELLRAKPMRQSSCPTPRPPHSACAVIFGVFRVFGAFEVLKFSRSDISVVVLAVNLGRRGTSPSAFRLFGASVPPLYY